MKMDALVPALAIIATAVMASVGAVDGAKALLLIGVLALRSLALSCPDQRKEGTLPGGQEYRTGPSAPSPPQWTQDLSMRVARRGARFGRTGRKRETKRR